MKPTEYKKLVEGPGAPVPPPASPTPTPAPAPNHNTPIYAALSHNGVYVQEGDLAKAQEVVKALGFAHVEEDDGGWSVEVPQDVIDEMETNGYLEKEVDGYKIEAEMP